MTGISFTGIGSGLQVSEIVDAIVNAEKVPYESRANRKQGEFTTDISAVGALKGALEAVTSSFEGLGDVEEYQKRTISGRDDFVGLSSDKDAEVGKYSVKVNALATNHKVMSNTIDGDEAVGEGTLSFLSGDNSFDIVVTATDKLSDIRDSINKSVKNKSVIATIITDDTGQHLVMSSKKTGVENAITVNVTDTSDGNNSDALGLSRLASDASNQLKTSGIAKADTVGEGTLSFASGVDSFDISVSNTDTLADIMDKVNDSNTNNSVRARIINDGTEDRLIFSSLQFGSGHEISIVVSDAGDANNTDNLGLSRLAYDSDPMSSSHALNLSAQTNVTNLNEVEEATDASITIDGTIVVSSDTNVFKDAIDGVTITANKLHGADDDISKVSISEDNKNIASGINTFIESFNALVDLSGQLGKSGNNENGVFANAGALAGDSLLRGVMSKIRGQFNKGFDSGNSNTLTLSQLGVRTELSGKLSFEQETLDDLLDQSPDAIQTFFLGSEGDNGFVEDMNNFVGFYTDSNGLISQRIEGKNNQIEKLNSDLVSFNEKMASLESRLLSQYNAMDLIVSQMNSTSSFLLSQLDNMPGVVKQNN
jgi:flagellar hook-associated protein 2